LRGGTIARTGLRAQDSTTSSQLHRSVALVALTFLAGCGGETKLVVVDPESATVARVGDGDTLDVRSGERIRLLQIDAPELGEGECYGRDALRALARLVPVGSRVSVQADPDLDDRDRYGRLLRYVTTARGVIVNVELVRLGAATPYFRGGEQGLHADELLAAVEDARRRRVGMWRSCRVSWQPERLVTTRPR
jgi:endonuclease YncB( thermonuclease family)